MGLFADGAPDSNTLSAIFLTNKKKISSVNPLRGPAYFFYLCFLVSLGECTDRSPTAWGTVGDQTTILNSPWQTSLPVYSAAIRPPPLSEILFLYRFEQGEEGRWSRKKRQACGPLTTSCSLFYNTKNVPRSMLRAAVSPARHSRRRYL